MSADKTFAAELHQMLELLDDANGAHLTDRAERAAHFKRNTELAKDIAQGIPASERPALIMSVEDYLRDKRPNAKTREVLYGLIGLLEQDYSCRVLYRNRHPEAPAPRLATFERVAVPEQPVAEAAAPEKAEFPFVLSAGSAPLPTAFVRSSLFTSSKPGDLVFNALGLREVSVLRQGEPLSETHLQVMLYLLARVCGNPEHPTLPATYTPKTAARVSFKAWDAIEALGWSRNSASLLRLRRAFQALQQTLVLLRDPSLGTDGQVSSPMLGVVQSALDKTADWSAEVMWPVIYAVVEHRSFLHLPTLATLPNGTATWCYAFIKSLPRELRETEWNVDELAQAAGISTACPYKRKEKLKEALDVLKAGVVEVKARGAAAHQEGKGELVECDAGLRVKGAVTKLREFRPVLESYRFTKSKSGKQRVQLVLA